MDKETEFWTWHWIITKFKEIGWGIIPGQVATSILEIAGCIIVLAGTVLLTIAIPVAAQTLPGVWSLAAAIPIYPSYIWGKRMYHIQRELGGGSLIWFLRDAALMICTSLITGGIVTVVVYFTYIL